MSGKKVTVIGAGIVGTSTALFLQQDGHDVTLIDPLQPGAGTSSGNAAIMSLASCLPVATPGVLKKVPGMLMDQQAPLHIRWRYLPSLLPWLWRFVLASRPQKVEELAGHIVALTSRALAAHQQAIQWAGCGDMVRDGGWLKFTMHGASFDAKTKLERATLERFEIPHEILNRDEILDLEPALTPKAEKALWLKTNKQFAHSQDYTTALFNAFRAAGGSFVQGYVHDIETINGTPKAVLADNGRKIPADSVVIATGAFAKELAAKVAKPVPIDTERGYHVMLPTPEHNLKSSIYSLDYGFVLAPLRHGVRLTSGVELGGIKAPADFAWVESLVPKAQELLPGLSGDIQSRWLGFRPSMPDSLPVIGPAPGVNNIYYAFGHGHIGLTLGPLTGRIIRDLIAGRDPGIDLQPYRADRRFY